MGKAMHDSSDDTIRLTRASWPRSPAPLLAALVVCVFLGGCAAITNPVANGISVRHLPEELLAPSKDGEQTIPLTMLGQSPPPTYRLAAGDVLGVYVEGYLGDHEPPLPTPVHVSPLIQARDQRRLPPAAGYPVPVEDDGKAYLSRAGSLLVQGMSIPEAREAIHNFYVRKELLNEATKPATIVTLLHPRQYHVVVMRQEAASFTSPFEGPFVSSKRGTGYIVDLPAYENDVLHALAQTGGLPGLDAYNAVIIQRNCFHGEQERASLMRQLESRPPGNPPTAVCAVGPVVRIPLRQLPGAPPCFLPEDVLLQTGDVVFLEARDEDLFYTGGLLPPGAFVLPRDHDLDVVEAVSRVRGPLFNGAFGGSNLAGNLIAPGLGDPSPSLLVILRRTPGGGQVPIVVDMREALRHPEERLLVRAGDVLLLQEKPSEAVARYVTQTFFNFNMIWQVVHEKFATGIVNIATPDRITGVGNVTINPK
jgi:protein involved in polysaccharide export with SLBB domain